MKPIAIVTKRGEVLEGAAACDAPIKEILRVLYPGEHAWVPDLSGATGGKIVRNEDGHAVVEEVK